MNRGTARTSPCATPPTLGRAPLGPPVTVAARGPAAADRAGAMADRAGAMVARDASLDDTPTPVFGGSATATTPATALDAALSRAPAAPPVAACTSVLEPLPMIPWPGEEPADAAWRARVLAAERDRIVLELAGLCRAVVDREVWTPFCFARLSDFARVRLGRSARWVRDLAALDVALRTLPPLAPALCGEDGPPIGRTAALWIGRTASAESVGAWIELARDSSARTLRATIRAARAAGSRFPVEPAWIPKPPRLDAEADEFAERTTLRLHVPASIRVAFEETLDLHRCVTGGEAPIESFVDALLGEAASRGEMPDPAALVEPRVTEASRASQPTREQSPAPEHFPSSPSGIATPPSLPPDGPDWEEVLLSRLQALIVREDEIERELGRILAIIGSQRAWGEIGITGRWDFSQGELGWSRTTAAARAWLARSLKRLPILRRAYESGRIGYVKALLVRRALGPGAVEPELERKWVGFAQDATVRRLQDELRLLRRKQVGDAESGGDLGAQCEGGRDAARRVFPPATDAEWFASLHRAPGTARERVARLGRQALTESDPNVLLGLNLTEDLAAAFEATLEHRLELLRAFAAPGDDAAIALGSTDPASAEVRGSVEAVRTFSSQGEPMPRWAGLLSMLEDYVETHDDPRSCPRRKWDEVYRRADWRCMAPGCTSRCNIHDHHLVYRSDQGSDELWNQLCLCAFHHLQGEHGELAEVRGRAPLDIIWRLGRMDLALWYRNDREIPAPAT